MNELLKEKNLLQIYKEARKIPFSRFNKIILVSFTIIFVVNGLFIDNKDLFEKINSVTSLLIGVVVSTMGFLIAGYTIFCTVMTPELSLKMDSCKGKYLPSLLKEAHFLFIRVFLYYLIYTFLLICVLALGGSSGIGIELIQGTANFHYTIYLTNLITYIVLFSGAVFLILQLASFIFNIYHTIMTTLAYEAVKQTE